MNHWTKDKKDKQFWNFTKKTENSAELTLYGEIASEEWIGNEVTHTQFYNNLKSLGEISELTVRINSSGGDVFAAFAIYNLLKSHTAVVTVIIDGWAASAATIIAMAGDVIQIPKAAVFMIHDPALCLWGIYKTEDFAKMTTELAAVKTAIIEAYCEKTGKTSDAISELMANETYLTGEEAVSMGFCDELLYTEPEITVTDSAHIVINKVDFNLQLFKSFPERLLPAPFDAESVNANNKTNNNKEDSVMDEIKTTEELKSHYPNLVKDIENAAKAEERKRIEAIEQIAPQGFEKLTAAAKFENPINAEMLAVQILQEQRKYGGEYLNARTSDINNSGIEDVKSGGFEEIKNTKEDEAEILAAMEKLYGRR